MMRGTPRPARPLAPHPPPPPWSQERLEKAAREKARIREEEERIAHEKALEAGRSRPPKPVFTNAEILHTARLRSLAHESRTSRAAQLRRAGRTSEEKGTRTRAHPEAVDLADSSEEEEEGEDQEQELQHEVRVRCGRDVAQM